MLRKDKLIIKEQKQSFMKGVFILMISQVLIKIFGFLYRWYLTNKSGFGDEGNGLYGAGYQLYTLLLALSSIGVPNAISKLVSEKLAIGDNRGAHRIFKIAIVLFGCIGFICSGILFFGASYIATDVMSNSRVEYTLMVLSPSVFFVAVSAVIRGYFAGFQDMKATANSQFLEQIFKTVLTITIVYLLTGQDVTIMAAGANLATTLATILSFIYLFIFYKKKEKQIWKSISKSSKFIQKNTLSVIKSIILVSIPISLSSIISAINRNVDSITVIRCLKKIGYSEEFANNLYGMLSGKIDNLINLPLSFNIAFAISLVPAIAAAISKKDRESAGRRISFSLMATMLIGLPCTFGLITMAEPILKLLFPNQSSGAMLLQISSLVIIFTVLAQTVNGALQGLSKVTIPVLSLGIGAIVKIFINISLIQIPEINIYGAAIGSIACHMISFIISFIALNKTIKLKLKFNNFVLKPVIATAMMCICCLGSYNTLLIYTNYKIATIFSLLLAVIIYLLLVVILKIFDKEDIYMLPGGKIIYKVLIKMHVYSDMKA